MASVSVNALVQQSNAEGEEEQLASDLEVQSVFAKGFGSGSMMRASSTPKRLTTPGRHNYSPFRPSTVITNLQRGNVQTTTPSIIQNMSLHQMAAQGELVQLQQELDQAGHYVDEVDSAGLTPLLWACANNQLATVKYLLDQGADVKISGNKGETPLLLASSYGHSDIVNCLLHAGLDVNCTDQVGNTALMYAAYQNEAGCLKTLLEWGADITHQNDQGLTVMEVTVQLGNKAAQQVIERHMIRMLDPEAEDVR